VRTPENVEHATSNDVRYELRDAVARLTLVRPQRANALSTAVTWAMVEFLERAANDPRVRVVEITGAGSVFCAGIDLTEPVPAAEESRLGPVPMRGVGRNVLEVLLEMPVPTLALVNGPAVAGGCELALACDLRVVSTDAFFQLPEAKRGLAANFATVVLAGIVPRGIAAEWLFTGKRVSAEEALRWGLANRIANATDLAATAAALVAEISENAPLSLRRMKEMMVKSWGMPLPVALRLGTLGPSPYLSADRFEGVSAFFDKRAPQWQGR
jgi:enoyl-CoA hydratase/carnithine racemase